MQPARAPAAGRAAPAPVAAAPGPPRADATAEVAALFGLRARGGIERSAAAATESADPPIQAFLNDSVDVGAPPPPVGEYIPIWEDIPNYPEAVAIPVVSDEELAKVNEKSLMPEGHMPRPFELLAHRIPLPACSGVDIVEWKATAGRPLTDVSRAGVDVVNRACAIAVSAFDRFLRKEGLRATRPDAPLSVDLSLLPWDVGPEERGANPRNLNDTRHRFWRRAIAFGWYPPQLYGLYVLGDRHIFMRNDPLRSPTQQNDEFLTVMVHEFFHALSAQRGVRDTHSELEAERHATDERYAQKFTRYLGLPEPD